LAIGDEGNEIHISAALADAVDGALDMFRSGDEGGVCVGDGKGGIVVGVNSKAG
jgi:hypothetical protein